MSTKKNKNKIKTLSVDLYVGYTCWLFLKIILIVLVCGPELTASHKQLKLCLLHTTAMSIPLPYILYIYIYVKKAFNTDEKKIYGEWWCIKWEATLLPSCWNEVGFV